MAVWDRLFTMLQLGSKGSEALSFADEFAASVAARIAPLLQVGPELPHRHYMPALTLLLGWLLSPRPGVISGTRRAATGPWWR